MIAAELCSLERMIADDDIQGERGGWHVLQPPTGWCDDPVLCSLSGMAGALGTTDKTLKSMARASNSICAVQVHGQLSLWHFKSPGWRNQVAEKVQTGRNKNKPGETGSSLSAGCKMP